MIVSSQSNMGNPLNVIIKFIRFTAYICKWRYFTQILQGWSIPGQTCILQNPRRNVTKTWGRQCALLCEEFRQTAIYDCGWLILVLTCLFTIIWSIIYRGTFWYIFYLQNDWLSRILAKSRWKDKVTSTKIRGFSTLVKLRGWTNNANILFCAIMVICNNIEYNELHYTIYMNRYCSQVKRITLMIPPHTFLSVKG